MSGGDGTLEETATNFSDIPPKCKPGVDEDLSPKNDSPAWHPQPFQLVGETVGLKGLVGI